MVMAATSPTAEASVCMIDPSDRPMLYNTAHYRLAATGYQALSTTRFKLDANKASVDQSSALPTNLSSAVTVTRSNVRQLGELREALWESSGE
jgi:hypothetical protein